jgi:hypothetical protein
MLVFKRGKTIFTNTHAHIQLFRGFKTKAEKTKHFLHGSQKRPASADIDFSSLGLKYPITHSLDFIVPRTGFSKPPTELPSTLPFSVSLLPLQIFFLILTISS